MEKNMAKISKITKSAGQNVDNKTKSNVAKMSECVKCEKLQKK